MENTEKRMEQSNENMEKVVGGGTETPRYAVIIKDSDVLSNEGYGDVIGRVCRGEIVQYFGKGVNWAHIKSKSVTGYIYYNCYILDPVH